MSLSLLRLMSSDISARDHEAVRVGVDIQAISPFDAHSEPLSDAIQDRVFTETEREYCEGQRDPQQHYAVRWAAKEAFVKLLEVNETPSYHEINIIKDGAKPRVALDTEAQTALCRSFGVQSPGDIALDVTLSHDRDADVALAEIYALNRRKRNE